MTETTHWCPWYMSVCAREVKEIFEDRGRLFANPKIYWQRMLFMGLHGRDGALKHPHHVAAIACS